MKYATLIVVPLLVGCASNVDYAKYLDTQAQLQVAKSNAEAERYRAMAAIAVTGDSTAKVAAMFALQNGSSINQMPIHVAAPKSAAESAKDWLGLLLPATVQAYGIHSQKQTAIAQSNNARDVAVSTNNAFVSLGNSIANSASQAGDTITVGAGAIYGDGQIMSGTGVLGSGSYSTNTLSGTGTTGTGSYSTNTLSGTGTTGTGNYTTNTATPTVVNGRVCSVDSTGTMFCN